MHRICTTALLAVPFVLAGCGAAGGDAPKNKSPLVVATMAAATADYTPQLSALGTVTPLQSVAVHSRVDGQITAILFHEGDNVAAGQPLFRLDDRAVRATIAQNRATLGSAQANAAQAQADYARAEQLVGKGFISKTTLDQKQAAALSGKAGIDGARAAIVSAQTSLSYLTVRAPVSGRTGEIGFKLGATVRAADAVPLVTINQLNPITVRFLVPPASIQAVRSAIVGTTVTARTQGSDASAAPIATGRLAFLDNNVDPGNGSVAAKAQFDNRGDALWPGAIVTVSLPLGTGAPRVVLPESAVQTGRDAPFVWTVGGDGKVAMRDVDIAGRSSGQVFIASGIKPGETIVVDALAKLKPGDPVKAKPVSSAALQPRAAG